MVAQEYVKKLGLFKKAYSLAVTVAPDSEEHFYQEFRLVKESLVQWKQQRGNACDTVMFSIVSDLSLHDTVKDVLNKVYEGERDLSPILKSVKVLVGVLDKSGKPVHEYQLGVAQ